MTDEEMDAVVRRIIAVFGLVLFVGKVAFCLWVAYTLGRIAGLM